MLAFPIMLMKYLQQFKRRPYWAESGGSASNAVWDVTSDFQLSRRSFISVHIHVHVLVHPHQCFWSQAYLRLDILVIIKLGTRQHYWLVAGTKIVYLKIVIDHVN